MTSLPASGELDGARSVEADPDLRRLHARPPSAVADAVGELCSPVVVVLALVLGIAVHAADSLAAGLLWGGLAALFVAGLPYAYLHFALHRGLISDAQIVIRSQRTRPALITLLLVGAGTLLLWRAGAPPLLFATVLALLAGVLLMTLVTLAWKASTHTATPAGALVILHYAFGTPALAGVVVLALVGWARVRAGRHSLPQVLAGAAIGALPAYLVLVTLAPPH